SPPILANPAARGQRARGKAQRSATMAARSAPRATPGGNPRRQPMIDAHIAVRFEAEENGFTQGKDYDVLAVEGKQVLLIDDDARLVWVEAARAVVAWATRGSERLFDLATHRTRRGL